jgi:2-keto-3-deoxy-L-rhamnonate aldolase RhmA
MIESPKAVDNAADIAAVDGVDILFFGSNDLCIEMGIPGDLANSRVGEAYRHVLDVAGKAGKFVGLGGVYTPDLLERYLPMGFHMTLLGSDLPILVAGAREKAALAQRIVERR